MWHGLVAQDFVNIAKTNAYLLLGSAAPFLIIMSFLMVTVNPLQEPLRACTFCATLSGAIWGHLRGASRVQGDSRSLLAMCAQAQVVVVDVAQMFAKACPVRLRAGSKYMRRTELARGAYVHRILPRTVYDRCAGPFTSPGPADSCFPR